MMRKMEYKLLMISLLLSVFLNGQNEKTCGFLFAQEMARKQYPDYDKKMKELEQFKTNSNLKLSSITQTIPVVFHVLHLNGSENVSDAQIQSAITVLNRDFRKLNSDTTSIVSQFKPIAADVNVEFRLANLDPDGKCTNGITRHYDSKTNWTPDLAYYTYTWPPNKYMNVYVVKSMQAGAAAYTYLPGSVPSNADAIVVLHNYLGNIGTGSNFGSRTLTHETGHWLGLSHVWGNTNSPGVACGDDGVTDTPLTKGHNSCSLSNAIICTPSITENIQNYMEYSYCTRMFTIGQSNLMNGILASTVGQRNSIVSSTNMVATGIVNPNYNCAPKPEFGAPGLFACEQQQFTFTDYSYNGPVTNWLWSSTGAINTSTLQNGALTFTATGLIPVTLKVSNTFGADSVTKTNYIVVLSDNGAALNIIEGFESGIFPNSQWIGSVPQFGSGFAQTATVAATGSKSMYVNNYGDNPNSPVYLYTPKYDLTNVSGAQLNFKYAYAQQGSSDDALRVYASKDCGANWNLVYYQSGSNLATTAAVNGQPFNSPLSAEWKSEATGLSQYQGEAAVFLKFEFTSDPGGPGNNFYVDDINVSGTVGLTKHTNNLNQLVLFPNPAKTSFQIKSENSGIGPVEILDITGKVILTKNGENSKDVSVPLQAISNGIYLVKINMNGFIEYRKLIIE